MILRSSNNLRLHTAILAVILGIGAIWLLATEAIRPRLPFFPITTADTRALAAHGSATAIATRIGWPRGDLAVEYAMTANAPLLGDIARGIRSATHPQSSNMISAAERAAALAPYDSRAWLVLAAANIQSGSNTSRVAAQIKMSYYTSPNDIRLSPFRIEVATRIPATDDSELQGFVENEIRTIFLHYPNLKSSVAIAYRGASPAGQQFLEKELAELDPQFLRELNVGRR